VLAATALFGSYTDAVSTALGSLGNVVADAFSYEIIHPLTLVGVIIGGATVFLFSGLAIDAVTRAAGAIVFEVRRQFREMPGIMTGKQRPEYGRVVDICTRDSLRELATPGLLAATAPIFVGFALGVGALAGFLAGAIGTGVLMAVFLANSGGSWDNAKKIVEDGHHGGKHSPAHEATIIGDTVGDPFKDTAGPAINPLIKVMNLVALLIAPAVVLLTYDADASGWLRWVIAGIAGITAIVAVAMASRRSHAGGLEFEADAAAAAEGHGGPSDKGGSAAAAKPKPKAKSGA
jgi:K(+)-stimulated pyrophosphate-energized sodium pump